MLVVLGEGGHTTELLNLIDLLGDNYEYHYIISKEDNISADRIRYPGPIYAVTRPRGKQTGLLNAVFRTMLTVFEAFKILWHLRPAAMVSTGPAIFVPFSLMGRLLRVTVIFVETGSRIKAPSLTGRLLYPLADLFFVQWPQLKEKLPRAVYAGRLY